MLPSISLFISLIFLSHAAIFVRLAHASPAAIGFWRMGIAVPVLFVLLAANRRFGEVVKLRRRQWGALLLCGFLLFLHWWSWFAAVQRTTLANSMVLFSISPLFTALGAWIFFREKMQKQHLLAMALCFAGVVCLFGGSLQIEPARLRGDFLGLLASMLFSAYVLASKGARRELGNLPFAFVTYSFCAAFFVGLMIFSHISFSGYDQQTWAAFALLAFGTTLLGHALFTYCLQFFNVNLMNIVLLSEPIIAAWSAYFFLGERVNSSTIAGFAFVAAGIGSLFLPYFLRKARAPV